MITTQQIRYRIHASRNQLFLELVVAKTYTQRIRDQEKCKKREIGSRIRFVNKLGKIEHEEEIGWLRGVSKEVI